MRKAILEKHIDSQFGNAADTESGAKQEPQPSTESSELAQLVWKYFNDEIRESLLEVQESLADENLELRQQLTQQNQEGK